MDPKCFTCNLQLFVQPSLSNIYLKNNRSMTNSDFQLQFPSIPLKFGLSSDLASGWSRLVYEQSLVNRGSSSIEVEVLGLGSSEAQAVEDCVKLLFGFKIQIETSQLWLFLRIVDMLGISQSPLSPVDVETVQEKILQYALLNLDQINLIEGWDYILSLLETDNIIIRKYEIKQLSNKVLEKMKIKLTSSNFEILCNYGYDRDPEQKQLFNLKDLKREHYIQLRTMFYKAISNQELTSNQNLVRVLFEELDTQFELDGYVNRQFLQIESKINQISVKLSDQANKFQNEQINMKQTINNDINQIRMEINEIKQELKQQKIRKKNMLERFVTSATRSEQYIYLGTSNGYVELLPNKILIEVCNNSITALKFYDNKLIIGTDNGDIFIYEDNIQIGVLKAQKGVLQILPHKMKYLISSHYDGNVIVWDIKKQIIIYESLNYAYAVQVLYIHVNLGDFVAMGDTEGLIRLAYYNTAREKPTLDPIKRFKNANSPVLALSCIPLLNDLMLTSHQDQSICVWNWDQETLLTIIKLENKCKLLFSGLSENNPFFFSILENGVVQFYQFDSNKAAKFIQQYSTGNTPVSMFLGSQDLNYQLINSNGTQNLFQITEDGFTTLTSEQLQIQSQFQLHQSCVYAISALQYPYFVSGSDDRTIKVFNIHEHDIQPRILKGHQAYVRSVAILQGTKHIASGSYDSTVKIWEISTSSCLNTLTGHAKPVLAVQTLKHTEYLFVSAGEDAIVKCWNWKSAICIWTTETGRNEVWSLLGVRDVCSGYFGLLTGHKDGLVRLFNIGHKGEQSQLDREIKPHKSFVNTIIQLYDNFAATASSDHLISIINWKTSQIIRVLKGHHDIVWDLALINQYTLISSSTEGKIKIWNWINGQCLNTVSVAKGSVYTLLKVPNSSKVLSGTASGEIIVWKHIQPQQTEFSGFIRINQQY